MPNRDFMRRAQIKYCLIFFKSLSSKNLLVHFIIAGNNPGRIKKWAMFPIAKAIVSIPKSLGPRFIAIKNQIIVLEKSKIN
jgi:hypothetical protein